MPYESFHNRFPEIAEQETRTIIVINDPDLPDGEYGLIESYCNEPDCDCRRVFFNVYDWEREEILAVIAYGWEDVDYYADWLGFGNPDMWQEMKGPALSKMSKQSPLAPVLLEKVKVILQDEGYVKRLQRHYRLFRSTVDAEEQKPHQPRRVEKKVGRNDPCPCGSGKKYKYCCGRRGQSGRR